MSGLYQAISNFWDISAFFKNSCFLCWALSTSQHFINVGINQFATNAFMEQGNESEALAGYVCNMSATCLEHVHNMSATWQNAVKSKGQNQMFGHFWYFLSTSCVHEMLSDLSHNIWQIVVVIGKRIFQ